MNELHELQAVKVAEQIWAFLIKISIKING